MDYIWTRGENSAISHLRKIDAGAYGEVHEVLPSFFQPSMRCRCEKTRPVMYVAALFVSDCESGVREEDNTSIRRRHGKGYPERSQSSRETLQARNTQEYRLRVPARQVIDVAIFSRYGALRPRFRRLDLTPLDSRRGTKTAAPHGNRTLKDKNDTNMGRYGGPHQGSCIHSFTRPCPQRLETSQQYPSPLPFSPRN